jgi:hypothetical protein
VVVLVVLVQTFQATAHLELLHLQRLQEQMVQTEPTSVETVEVEVPVVVVSTVELGLAVVETVLVVEHRREQVRH